MSRLHDALRFTLQWEGGYVNDPDDPGGATNKGVTQAVYTAWRYANRLPYRSVEGITAQEAEAIYEDRYWKLCRCGDLPAPVDVVVFDTAVNCGPGRACRFLQRALGVTEDGNVGPRTLAAVREYGAPLELARKISGIRDAYYREIVAENPKLKKFLNGWTNRLGDLNDTCGL